MRTELKTISRTKLIVTVGVFSAIAFLLQLIGSFIGLKVGGFLEVEFSDVPALILAMAYGPVAGMSVEFVKNLLHLAVTSTGGVGELANFVIGGILCFAAGIIYRYKRTYKGALLSLLSATLLMTAAGMGVNKFIMLPLYMPNAEEAFVNNLLITVIMPFNLIKGIVISGVTVLLYKRISRVIK